mmetsp:Transcript_35252/g.56637  ORF Transcript_35252/g.56637 Transcript_35252/m.56637 type:complete len:413 (+) Transcript_35252:1000-2238(+)
MEELMRGVQTVSSSNLTNEKRIIVTIRARDVPNIDLIDLPGFCSDPKDNVVVEEALADQVEQNPHSIYLAVLKASAQPISSYIMSWIIKKELENKTLGVFTHTDKVRDLDERKQLCARINATTKQEADECQGLILPNYGWIAVSNSSQRIAGEVLDPVSRNPNFQRLQRQGIVERQLFALNNEWRSLYSTSKAGMKALVKKVEHIYKDNLVENWVPDTLIQLNHASRLESLRFNMLGMPSATQVASKALPGNWMSVIQTRAENAVVAIVKGSTEEMCEAAMKEAFAYFRSAEATKLVAELSVPVELRGVHAHAEWCAKTLDAWQRSVEAGLTCQWLMPNTKPSIGANGFLKERLCKLEPLPSTYYEGPAKTTSNSDICGSVFVAAGAHPSQVYKSASGTLEVRHCLSPEKLA